MNNGPHVGDAPPPDANCSADDGAYTGNGTTLARVIVSDPALQDVVENRLFHFFRLETVASTNNLLDSRFWHTVVLQLYYAEPAVKHAVLALSSTHQVREAAGDTELALRHQDYADRQYSKALAALQSLIAQSNDEDVESILVASSVVLTLENVRGNYEAGKVHAEAGRRILAYHSQRDDRRSRRSEVKELKQLFRRLDVAADSFSDSRTGYPIGDEAVYCAYPTPTDHFNSLDDARSSLIDLIRGTQFIACDAVWNASLDKSQAQERAHLLGCLQDWNDRFSTMLTVEARALKAQILTLRIWYLVSKAPMVVGWKGGELRWDALTDLFNELVSCGEQLLAGLAMKATAGSFGFDLGYIAPIFFTVERCRDPVIRRRALSILKAEVRQEGVWESSGAAKVAERWMLIEEAGLEVKVANDIPEWHRLQYVDVALETPLKRALVVFKLSPADLLDHEKLARDRLMASENGRQVEDAGLPRTMVPSRLRLTSMSGHHRIEHRVVVAESTMGPEPNSVQAIHALFDC
ncbi:hypothetical protein LTR95_009277 [Oleoguttula sp. CCFEE 5521]